MIMPNSYYKRPVTVRDFEVASRYRKGCITLIEDDVDFLASMASVLEFEGYAVRSHVAAESYLASLEEPDFNYPGPGCVICDVHLPGMTVSVP